MVGMVCVVCCSSFLCKGTVKCGDLFWVCFVLDGMRKRLDCVRGLMGRRRLEFWGLQNRLRMSRDEYSKSFTEKTKGLWRKKKK